MTQGYEIRVGLCRDERTEELHGGNVGGQIESTESAGEAAKGNLLLISQWGIQHAMQ